MRRGSAMLGECDRRGMVELFTREGRSVILPTTCKTWGCVVCRKKLAALFRARVETGVSRLGRCSFITITYLATSDRLADAACVMKDWTALWRRLRRRNVMWEWLKVTEMTQRGIPHHHAVVGNVTGTIRCHGTRIRKGSETARYIGRMPWCDCTAHMVAREWKAITGDSFMCFATPVESAEHAGGYLAKYFEKQFGLWKGRRFSNSRGWPAGKRRRLQVTEQEGWDYIRMWPLAKFDTASTDDLNEREADLMVRVGDDLMERIEVRNRARKARKGHERSKNVSVIGG